jgi:predicted nicotinamide N-methyase
MQTSSNDGICCCHCAAGVVGLTAAALGSAEVLLTDLPHHVQHISSNIKV